MIQTTECDHACSTPLVSVCVPSFNNERFIAATLESVLNQTYSNFEILITDDCSTDRTVSIIREFSDPRIRLVQNEVNLGIAENWRTALSAATGKYVKLLCGDDLIYPDCLRRQVQILEEKFNSGMVLTICGREIINARGEVILRSRPRLRKGRMPGGKLIRNCVRCGTNFIGEPGVGLYRREAADPSVAFDLGNPYMVDMDLWAELLKRGDAFVDERVLVGFRISTASVSARLGLKHAAYFRRFVQKIRANPVYGVKWFDVFLGYCLSIPWGLLRNLLIAFRAREGHSGA